MSIYINKSEQTTLIWLCGQFIDMHHNDPATSEIWEEEIANSKSILKKIKKRIHNQ